MDDCFYTIFLLFSVHYRLARHRSQSYHTCHSAAAINPLSTEVQAALERLEAIVRGVDVGDNADGAAVNPEDSPVGSANYAGGRPSY